MRRSTSALTTTIFGAVLSASGVSAQQSPPPTRTAAGASAAADADAGFGMAAARGARHLLRNGLDYIEYQEFDRALKYLREAERRQAELNEPERTKLKQGIERAQRGTREAIGSEKPYALSQRSLRSGGFAPAAAEPVMAAASRAKARPAAREGDDRAEPIQLAGAEAPAPVTGRSRLAAAPPPLPEIPEAPAASRMVARETSAAVEAAGDLPTAPPVARIDPVAAGPRPIPTVSAPAFEAAPAAAPEVQAAAAQAQADLTSPFPALDPAPAADPAVTRSRTASPAKTEAAAADPAPAPVLIAEPEPAAAPEPAPAPALADASEPAPIRLELPDEIPSAASAATSAPTAPAPPADAPALPSLAPTPAPEAEPVPTPGPEATSPATAARPTPAAMPGRLDDPALDLPALPADLRDDSPTIARPPAEPVGDLPPLPGETDRSAAMAAPAAGLLQEPAPVPAQEPAPAPLPAQEAPTPATAAVDEGLPAPADAPASPPAAAPTPTPAPVASPASFPEFAPEPGSSAIPPSGSGFVPPRGAPRTILTPEMEHRVNEIVRRQEEAARDRIARRQTPTSTEPDQAYDPSRDPAIDTRTQTQIDISRAPSPAEVRPINAIPVPEDWVPLGARTWSPQRKYWAAAATCHLPLYFQDPMLERYGHSVENYMGPAGRYFAYPVDNHKQSTQRNQVLQPFASAGQFAFQILTLPYALIVDPPWEAQYDLGYWRPGDKIPTDMYYLPTHGIGPAGKGMKY